MNLILRQCKKVAETAYMINWYYLPQNIILALLLIILRSRITIKITAGKFFHMSIATFGAVSIEKILNKFYKLKFYHIKCI